METMRITLVILQALVILFLVVEQHHGLSRVRNPLEHERPISANIGFICDVLRVCLYHSACIVVVWFSQHWRAPLVRASGLLLVVELVQIITSLIRYAIEIKHVDNNEVGMLVVHFFLLLTTLLLTCRFAEKITTRRTSAVEMQLVVRAGHDQTYDESIEPVAL